MTTAAPGHDSTIKNLFFQGPFHHGPGQIETDRDDAYH